MLPALVVFVACRAGRGAGGGGGEGFLAPTYLASSHG